MPLYVGRIPTNKWNGKAGPALLAAGVFLEQPTPYEVGVQVEASDLDDAYSRIEQALDGCGLSMTRDAFAMALYTVGPGTIAIGPPE